MKTIEEAALEYARYGVEHDRDKRVFNKGVEFAQRWIPVEEELPLAYESGHWDGLRSDFVLAKDDKGKWHKARTYQGTMDGCKFCEWVDENDDTFENIVSWRPIEYK